MTHRDRPEAPAPPPNEEESVFDDDESMAQESHQGTEDEEKVSGTKASTARANGADFQDIGKQENRMVFCCRIIVVVLLLVVTGCVAWGVFFYSNNAEQDTFHSNVADSQDKLVSSLGLTLDRSLGAMDSLMVDLVAYQQRTNSTWPNVTMDDFAVIATKVLSMSRGTVIGVAPKVTSDQRLQWEEYSEANDGWVDNSLRVQRKDPTFKGFNMESWTPIPQIHGNDGPTSQQEKYYPTWTTAPIVPRFGAYNFDLYGRFSKEIDACERSRSVVMGQTQNVVLPGQPQDDSTINWYRDLVGDFLDPTEPIFSFFSPIVTNAADDISVSDEGAENHTFVGIISMTISWSQILKNTLSPGTKGVVVVIGNDCNMTITYELDGPDAKYLGPGDRHDKGYNKLGRKVYLASLGDYDFKSRIIPYTGFPLDGDFCPYFMSIYPSGEMEGDYTSNNPLLFTLVAVSIFVFTSAVFLVFDCISERRQKKVLQVAVQSSAVVSNLFPQVVRDRIFLQKKSEEPKAKEEKRIETAKLRLQKFLRNDEDKIVEADRESGGEVGQAPIAELFSDTTVMFADIAGFTAWSSAREPAQVFTLLETLYGAFDRIAARRGVFKVETIGDSYVAVAGLPEPRADHAVVMAKFARDIREKMQELTQRLGTTLGPDTSELQVRIGLNSGPVTAGVLRGERSRFQLFGDTVNTAARMESTGKIGKIQASMSTANILMKAGKGHWVTKREGEVNAKGKGKIQTYWLEPTTRQASSVSADEIQEEPEGKVMDEKTRRLVDWNVEILAKLLKQIVSRREARRELASRKGLKASEASHVAIETVPGSIPLDEVREVIMLPEYDPAFTTNPRDPNTIQLGSAVMTQLREYIALIAGMYHENPFHNFEHASHVTMSVVKLLSRIVAPTENVIKNAQEGQGDFVQSLHDHTYGITSDPLTQFACVFCALIHDVDHPGVPNMQLVKEGSRLDALYKGKSLAEQNSVDLAWKLFMEDEFEDLRNIICGSQVEMRRFRQLVVNGVMATDIMDKDLKDLRNQRWDKAFKDGSRLGETVAVNINRKATIVIEHLIQASDVAHTMQHWHIYRKWNERLFTEMYTAYRAGRAEKNPAEFWYKGEMGFLDFYVIPLAKKLSDCGVFGVSSDEYLSYAMKNREEWENRGLEVVASMVAKFEVPKEVVGANDKLEIKDDDKEDTAPVAKEVGKEAAKPAENLDGSKNTVSI